MPVATLPRPLRKMLGVIAWLTPLLWIIAITGIWLFRTRGVVVATGAASTATFCALTLHMSDVAERNASRRLEEYRQGQAALIIGIDRLSNAATRPQRALKAVRN